MWEVDLRITLDRLVIVFHDEFLENGRAIAELKYSEIVSIVPAGAAPKFSEVIGLAKECGAGIYADIKTYEVADPACRMLKDTGLDRVILGAFDASIVKRLGELNISYPRAILVPIGVDPFDVVGDAEIIHLCWEHMENPLELLDDIFFEQCRKTGKQVVLWHEEDPERMARLRKLPVLGICSDQPELVNPFKPSVEWPVQIVCHRGANSVAPENSMAAARACFAAGFSHVEIDVHVTRDSELVVIHDASLERTSDGAGLVTDHTLEQLRLLSIGSWFSEHHRKEIIPTLAEILGLAVDWNGKLYVELKSAPADLIWDCVCMHNMEENCFFWSFDVQLLRDLRQISSKAKIMMRRQDFDSLEATLKYLSPVLIEFTSQEDLSELELLRETGITSMVAYNGNDKEVFRRIASNRPDMVNLHEPFEFVKSIFENGCNDA